MNGEQWEKVETERVIPEGMWWVLCSYSSNRYPAETDQQDQEMRNLNEEVEGQRAGGGSDAEVDASERISLLSLSVFRLIQF